MHEADQLVLYIIKQQDIIQTSFVSQEGNHTVSIFTEINHHPNSMSIDVWREKQYNIPNSDYVYNNVLKKLSWMST